MFVQDYWNLAIREGRVRIKSKDSLDTKKRSRNGYFAEEY